MSELKIDTLHPDYTELQEKRERFSAVEDGTYGVRKRGVALLPKYPAELPQEYEARLKRSRIDGLVRMGIDTLCGKVFEYPIDRTGCTLPTDWLDNFDNMGTSLDEFAAEAFEESFDGCSVIYVDYPQTTEQLAAYRDVYAREADIMLNIRPYARIYEASQVINWFESINPVTQIKYYSLLVLKECSEVLGADGFTHEEVERYRVLRNNGGQVTWQLWRKEQDKRGKVTFILEGEGVITNVTEIPFASVGCLDDEPKLLNEAELELAAYLKESSFDTIEYLSVPSLYTKGYPKDSPPIALGASAHIDLPADTPNAQHEVGYIQIDAAGHTSLKETIEKIKETIKQQVSYATNTNQRQGDITATEVATAAKDKQARLVKWANELEDAINKALKFMGQLGGVQDAGTIKLGTAWSEQAKALEPTPIMPPQPQQMGNNLPN